MLALGFILGFFKDYIWHGMKWAFKRCRGGNRGSLEVTNVESPTQGGHHDTSNQIASSPGADSGVVTTSVGSPDGTPTSATNSSAGPLVVATSTSGPVVPATSTSGPVVPATSAHGATTQPQVNLAIGYGSGSGGVSATPAPPADKKRASGTKRCAPQPMASPIITTPGSPQTPPSGGPQGTFSI
jgi:hypothetical protein